MTSRQAIAAILARIEQPYERPIKILSELDRARLVVAEGHGTPEDWERVAVLYDRFESLDRAAQMFRQAARRMREDGMRFGLEYPDNQEEIVLIGLFGAIA